MSQLNTFISSAFRPDIRGGSLMKEHKSVFSLSCLKPNKEKYINAICFGPKNDRVLLNLEHAIQRNDRILFFYYEDIHNRWSFEQTPQQKFFLFKQNSEEEYIIHPKKLYIRGCYLNPNEPEWRQLGEFFNFVELWKENVLCAPGKQVTNESKLFQLNNSLKRSTSGCNQLSIGKSYVIKGEKQFKQLNPQKNYVVKSLSGIRSMVVDKHDFQHWNFKHLNAMPVLFQEKVEGSDVRAHVLNNTIYAKISPKKTKVDYRYDAAFFEMIPFENFEPFLKHCITQISKNEDNPLMGIDFIKSSAGYTVLEANPSPGWSAYHECNGIQTDPLINQLIEVLKSA